MVDVQGGVPGRGNEDVVSATVADGSDGRGVRGEDCLGAREEIDPILDYKS